MCCSAGTGGGGCTRKRTCTPLVICYPTPTIRNTPHTTAGHPPTACATRTGPPLPAATHAAYAPNPRSCSRNRPLTTRPRARPDTVHPPPESPFCPPTDRAPPPSAAYLCGAAAGAGPEGRNLTPRHAPLRGFQVRSSQFSGPKATPPPSATPAPPNRTCIACRSPPMMVAGGSGLAAPSGEITGVGAQTGGLGSPMRPDHPDCNFYPPMNPPMSSLRRSGGITKAALQLPPLTALESRILECSHPHVYTFTGRGKY